MEYFISFVFGLFNINLYLVGSHFVPNLIRANLDHSLPMLPLIEVYHGSVWLNIWTCQIHHYVCGTERTFPSVLLEIIKMILIYLFYYTSSNFEF